MLRAIAPGTELNMAYPPRPTDPAIAREPDWNVNIHVQSMATTMLGMSGMGGSEETDDTPATDAPAPEQKKEKKSMSDTMKDVAKSAPGTQPFRERFRAHTCPQRPRVRRGERGVQAPGSQRTLTGRSPSVRSGTTGMHQERLERVMGIEPTLAAWEAAVLPLNYTRARRRF